MDGFLAAWDRCWAAAVTAWQRMRYELFTTATVEKWFTLGLTSWLANLAAGSGGGGFNFPNPFPRAGAKGHGGAAADWLLTAVNWCREHWLLVGAVAVAILLVVLAAWLVLLWVSCRGKFIFTDNVARRHLLVKEPWCEFKAQANSYLIWLIGLTAAFVGILTVWGGGVAAWLLTRPHPLAVNLTCGLTVVVVFLVVILAMILVMACLENFLIPLMYRDRLTTGAAWRQLGALLAWRPLDFVAYLLLNMVLWTVAGVAIVLAVFCTCCLAGCLMMIPYLGAVVLLPVTYFFRAFSLAFLEQVDPARPVLV